MISTFRLLLTNLYWSVRLINVKIPRQFDAKWYLDRYSDVKEAGVWPKVHYRRYGWVEGRDPGPDFSTSGYALAYPEVQGSMDPCLFFESYGKALGHQPKPEFSGSQKIEQAYPTFMVIGHQAGRELYGAERSLVDVVKALSSLSVNLFVVLPSAINSTYLDEIRLYSVAVYVLPYGWWRQGKEPCNRTVEHFKNLYCHLKPDIVYINTVTLDEPIVAANQCDVRVAVHIREAIGCDQDLARRLSTNQQQLKSRLHNLVDMPVANSRFTAEHYGFNNALIFPNCIDVKKVEQGIKRNRMNSFIVSMISSNTPKKGLYDFIRLSVYLKELCPNVRCQLVGPETHEVLKLKIEKEQGNIPKTCEFYGYIESPELALAEADVVVNLSHVEETFGRTILEAMAAHKAVVAYRWGALPEIIKPPETGYLVQKGDVKAVADCIVKLVSDRTLYENMSKAARDWAVQEFSIGRLSERMQRLVDESRKTENY